jgi:chromosome segregation ATPase
MLINFLSKNLIFILFTLTLFVLLVIQLTQLILQFALPALRKQIAALNQFWKDLQGQVDLLKNTKKRIRKEIKEQGSALENLEDKVKAWHNARAEQQKEEERLYKKRSETIKNKMQQQYQYILARKLEKKLIPEAITEAKQKLQEQYSGENGKKFLINIISKLSNS